MLRSSPASSLTDVQRRANASFQQSIEVDLNLDAAFTFFKGHGYIGMNQEAEFIVAALDELPSLVKAFLLARRDFALSPAPSTHDKLRLRTYLLNLVVEDVLENSELMECMEPAHLIIPHCGAFVRLWRTMNTWEESEEGFSSGAPTTTVVDELLFHANKISAALPSISTAESYSWREAAVDSTVLRGTLYSVVFLTLLSALVALIVSIVLSDKLSIPVIVAAACCGVAVVVLIAVLITHREAIRQLRLVETRYTSILGFADRFTRHSTFQGDRRTTNPLARPNSSAHSIDASPNRRQTSMSNPSSLTGVPPPVSGQTTVLPWNRPSVILSPPASNLPSRRTSASSNPLLVLPSQPSSSLSPLMQGANSSAQNALPEPLPLPTILDSRSSVSGFLNAGVGGGAFPFSPHSSMDSPFLKQTDSRGGVGTSILDLNASGMQSAYSAQVSSPSILLGPGLSAPLAPFHEEFVIITVDSKCDITFFNVQATGLTGFQAEEVLGYSISNLMDEDSYEKLLELVNQLLQGKTSSVPPQSFTFTGGDSAATPLRMVLTPISGPMLEDDTSLNGTRNSVASLSGTRTLMQASQEKLGVLLLGSLGEQSDRTNNVVLMRYFVSLIATSADVIGRKLQEASAVVNTCSDEALKTKLSCIPVAVEDVERCQDILVRCEWANICTVAARMLDWPAVPMEQLLVPTSRLYFGKLDLEVHAEQLLEVIECDVNTINEVLSLVLSSCKGRVIVVVETASLNDSPECGILGITVRGNPLPRKDDLMSDAQFTSRIQACGGSSEFAPPRGDQPTLSSIRLHFPYVFNVAQSLSVSTTELSTGTGGLRRANSQLKDGSGQHRALSFILYESEPLFRHSTSQSVWALGHALCTVDTPSDVTRVRSQMQIELAILDYNGPMFADIFALVRLIPNVIIMISYSKAAGTLLGSPPSQVEGFPVLSAAKPIKRKEIKRLTETADSKLLERQEKEKNSQLDRVLTAHHSSPWKRGKKLGSGTFGDVYEAENLLTGGKMAVKMIWLNSGNEQSVRDLLAEVDIMISISHQHIVHYFHCERARESLNLFMELCKDGTLAQYVASARNGRLAYDEAAAAMKQILLGLSYLHEQNIVHRDMKPENILINDGVIKIADFGTAVRVKIDTQLKDTSGTLRYMAPEIWGGEPYSFPCDIWSLGIILLEMIGRQPRWLLGATNFDLNILYCDLMERNQNPELPKLGNEDADQFIRACLQIQQSNRPTSMALLNSPFIVSNTNQFTAPTFRRAQAATRDDGLLIRRTSMGRAVLPATPQAVTSSHQLDPARMQSSPENGHLGSGAESGSSNSLLLPAHAPVMQLIGRTAPPAASPASPPRPPAQPLPELADDEEDEEEKRYKEDQEIKKALKAARGLPGGAESDDDIKNASVHSDSSDLICMAAPLM